MRLLRHMKHSWMICKVEAYISVAGTTGWVFDFARLATTKKSPESEIAKTIVLTCDVARSLPSRVHVT